MWNMMIIDFILNFSFVPDLLSCGCGLLLLPGWPGLWQHCHVHVWRLGEGPGGGHAPGPPHHHLPHHHESSISDNGADDEYPNRNDHFKNFDYDHLFADFNWKRCAFRTFSVFVLLFIAESVPSFGSILNLIGASTVTLLTFIFPPLFYMKLVDASSNNKEWKQRYKRVHN